MLVDTCYELRHNYTQGWNDVSFHGSSQIPTPNLDALAADGVILNSYYAQHLCTPSRAALLTGLYPIRTGLQHSVLVCGQPGGLPVSFQILPQYLKNLGYRTHMVGKWHLGYSKEAYTPTERGFESFYGYYNFGEDYYDHTLDLFLTGNSLCGLDLWNGKKPVKDKSGVYATHLFTDKAVNLIEEHDQSTPLFLYLSHLAVHAGTQHGPIQAPEENVRKFDYIGVKNRSLYAGAVDALDQSVGIFFQALEKKDMLQNTVLVFLSDNGAIPWGEWSNAGSNWPLRGAKFTLWEGGVRVPAFVWSPLLRKPQRVSNQLMHVSDWVPTLYSLAGGNIADLGVIDGLDMWEALSQDLPSPRREMLINFDSVDGTAALLSGDFKLVVNSYKNGTYDQRLPTPGNLPPRVDLDRLMLESLAGKALKTFYANRTGWSLPTAWRGKAKIHCGDRKDRFRTEDTPHLFDVVKDPCELQNLAGCRTLVLRRLMKKLQAYIDQAVPPMDETFDSAGYPRNNDCIWMSWQDPQHVPRPSQCTCHAPNSANSSGQLAESMTKPGASSSRSLRH
ncbi:arylsulfatase B-like [Ixodes scapularis]